MFFLSSILFFVVHSYNNTICNSDCEEFTSLILPKIKTQVLGEQTNDNETLALPGKEANDEY